MSHAVLSLGNACPLTSVLFSQRQFLSHGARAYFMERHESGGRDQESSFAMKTTSRSCVQYHDMKHPSHERKGAKTKEIMTV